jgi:hypothetical protein
MLRRETHEPQPPPCSHCRTSTSFVLTRVLAPTTGNRMDLCPLCVALQVFSHRYPLFHVRPSPSFCIRLVAGAFHGHRHPRHSLFLLLLTAGASVGADGEERTTRPFLHPACAYALQEGQSRSFRHLLCGLDLVVQCPLAAGERTPLVFVHGSFHAAWCWAKHRLPFFSPSMPIMPTTCSIEVLKG